MHTHTPRKANTHPPPKNKTTINPGYSVLAMAVHGDRVLWTTSSDNKLRAWDLSDAGRWMYMYVCVCVCMYGVSVLASVGPLVTREGVDNFQSAMIVTLPPHTHFHTNEHKQGNFALLGTAYMEGMGHPISLAVSGEGVYLGFQVRFALI